MGFLRKTNIAILILGLIGVVDAGYLSWVKMANTAVVCAPGLGDCGSVNNSVYSELYGIPVAYLGLLSYLLIVIAVSILLSKKVEINWINYLLLGITLVGVLFSGYLTYIELAVLYAICIYCVISAVLMLILFVVSLYKTFKLLNN
jgi:uncharacterized membrane protein